MLFEAKRISARRFQSIIRCFEIGTRRKGENQNECSDTTWSPTEDEDRNPPVHAQDGPEQVVELSLTELYPFKNHPFHVVDDVHMESTAQSIKSNGVLVPVIVRPRAEGGYEIISGHRRKDRVDTVVDILMEVNSAVSGTFRVEGVEISVRDMKIHFAKVNQFHVERMFENLDKHYEPITRRKNYMRTTLYNVIITMDEEIRAQVRQDHPFLFMENNAAVHPGGANSTDVYFRSILYRSVCMCLISDWKNIHAKKSSCSP